MKTPLGRVRGLGSAKSGTTNYIVKQASGLVLAILTPYVVVLGILLFGRPWLEVREAISSLWVAPALAAFILVSAIHMRVGMQVIIEDYVHARGLKMCLLVVNWLFSWGSAIITFFALLRLFAEPWGGI